MRYLLLSNLTNKKTEDWQNWDSNPGNNKNFKHPRTCQQDNKIPNYFSSWRYVGICVRSGALYLLKYICKSQRDAEEGIIFLVAILELSSTKNHDTVIWSRTCSGDN